MDKYLEDTLTILADEAARATTRALENLDTAEQELKDLRKQLELASDGQPFFETSRIDGPSARLYFEAIGSIRRIAQLRAFIERSTTE